MMLAAVIAHRHAELAGQHDVLAHVAQHQAHRRLGPAALAVDVGGVEQGDAEVECLVDHRLGGVLLDAAAEVVASQPDGGHAQTGFAEVADFHVEDSKIVLRPMSRPRRAVATRRWSALQ
jgi:hypothetical protein